MEELLRKIPSVDEFMKREALVKIQHSYPRWFVIGIVREKISLYRDKIKSGRIGAEKRIDDTIMNEIISGLTSYNLKKLKRVVNCTGTLIHTNLGRAPLSEFSIERVKECAGSYCNLELDLTNGKRGARGENTGSLFSLLTGAEDAIVVNNNAAALVLCLSTLASRKDVLISRGEIVEIGGGFRVNEIMKASQARLLEVGTTNKTRIEDFEAAVSKRCAVFLKVHTSNFKVVGYHEEVGLAEMARLGREKGITTIFDAGSGLMTDLSSFGLSGEPVIPEALKSGIDIVCFSTDKLFGGPQGGVIVGKKEIISRLKKNPLFRALRVCKLIMSALEGTLDHYIDGEYMEKVPVLEMISRDLHGLQRQAEELSRKLKKLDEGNLFEVAVKKGNSYVGGGSYPGGEIKTALVSLKGKIKAARLSKMLRENDPPVVARIENDELLLDLRTVLKHETMVIENAFALIFKRAKRVSDVDG